MIAFEVYQIHQGEVIIYYTFLYIGDLPSLFFSQWFIYEGSSTKILKHVNILAY